MAVLIAGSGCERHLIEVVNETASRITVTRFVEGDEFGPFVDEAAPGETLTLGVGSLEQRWEITDPDGVVLVEAIVSSGNVDFYDGRIVVR